MNLSLSKKNICICLCMLSGSNAVFSQELGFSSEAELKVSHNSNIYRTTSEVNDNILSINPTLEYLGAYGKQAIRFHYVGGYAAFNDNTNLNYAEHDVLVSAELDHTNKLSTEFTMRYRDQIETPGSNNSITSQVLEYNQFAVSDLFASLMYGTSQSSEQIVMQYAHSNFDYKNKGQEFRSYVRDLLSGNFFYKIGANTRFLFEASISDLSYENTDLIDLTSFQTRSLIGVDWSPSAATSTSLKVGYLNVDYDNNNLSDLSGLSYSFDLKWRPSSYTLIQGAAIRDARESAELLVGGYINNQFSISASHELTYKTKIFVGYIHSNYDFDSAVRREDTRNDLTAKLSFQSKNWLNLYLEYKVDKRSSLIEFYNYNANIVSVGVLASFN
ncbi:MAG: outer membrane beta-barrel protein [Paraglaciecola sp.]|uniref:outer membrane beta-barrel protein n=1 Tax=Paraglaciecola sp. TaxID=1920173 RepID=UPI00329A1E73